MSMEEGNSEFSYCQSFAKKVMSIKMAELLILLFTCQYTQEFNWIIKRVYWIIVIRKDKTSLSIALPVTVKKHSLTEGKKSKTLLS